MGSKQSSRFSALTKGRLILILMLSLTVLIFLVEGTKGAFYGRKLAPTPHFIPWSGQLADQAEAESITLLPTGFEPATITRPKGSFLFAIENRSGLDNLEFAVYRREGSNRQEVLKPTKRKKLDWSETIDLPPGQYELREINRPDWLFTLIITPK